MLFLAGMISWVTWNLFLAAIPVALAFSMRRVGTNGMRNARLLLWLLGFLWLIFLPNTCYLLTEWRHFFHTLEGARLYTRWNEFGDIGALRQLILRSLFFFTYSALGMLAFAMAVRPVHRLLRQGNPRAWLWGVPFFPLISLGVYLGLVLRFNSWDLLHRPSVVFASIWSTVTRPELIAFILGFGAFLWLAYFVLDLWVDGVLLRWRRRHDHHFQK
jgi:uncharacterized membrane protein